MLGEFGWLGFFHSFINTSLALLQVESCARAWFFLLLLFLFFKSLFKVTSASELLRLVEDDSHSLREEFCVGGC